MENDGCTGFGWLHSAFNGIEQCCDVHDQGGTDGMLVDCLFGVVPEPLWFLVIVCVAIMVLLRPLYHLWRRRSSGG